MNHNYNEDYQYDSCVSQGICSINPRTSSLQEVLVLYLKLTAFYTLRLYKKGINDKKAKNIILDTISVMVSNYDFSEKDFKLLVQRFNKILPILIKKFELNCANDDTIPECLKLVLKFCNNTNIIKAIQLGEKEFLRKSQSLSTEIRDLYKIIFVLVKSICINILDLETFENEKYANKVEEGYLTILNTLDNLDAKEESENEIKNCISEIAKIDDCLMKTLLLAREEYYGKQRTKEVSYTTTPAKAVLVVGSNIKELEDVLEVLKDEDIDVYTHDEMVLANTYPYFEKYPRLKGQYGQGIENCLLDFATFPGPIILTKHSLYNVEHLYRGLLFTTDFASSKGIIQIKNKDFSEVIKSAKNAKGFKTGRQCESVLLGYDYDEILNNIKKRINKYSRIFIIGLGAYTLEQKSYFEKLLEQVPEDVLVLTLSYCLKRENVICVNACFDTYAITKFAKGIKKETKLPISIFFPKCDRHTISQIMYLTTLKDFDIHVGKCAPIILNPNMIVTLKKVFGINGLTSVKKDLDEILMNKNDKSN